MLGQRYESSAKSRTLPRLDGQDEEGDVLENQFEILSIATNSCPDLTVLEIEPLRDHEDVVDGSGSAALNGIISGAGIAGSFRRSTSLNSLGVEGVDNGQRDAEPRLENGNGPPRVVPVLSHHLSSVGLKKEVVAPLARTALRASHSGASSHLQKSISSPSVTQYFIGAPGVQEGYQKRVQSDAHQHNAKRSFFRRKQKSKSTLVNPRPNTRWSGGGDKMETFSALWPEIPSSSSPALAALHDSSLGLQQHDAECWTLSMSDYPEVIAQLEDKEVKRQEHMYEMILTEKHHCLTLALMQHLFVGDMRRAGYARYARLLFPELSKLLEVHFTFLRRLRERQSKFRELGQPMDTITDILASQFTDTSEQYHLMIRLYGLLCASHTKSLDIFKTLIKEPKFASLVAAWDKESLLGRKNVRECLLLVAQRITKYPLLIEPILKTSLFASAHEKEQILESFKHSKELISMVNHRVAQRERLLEFCNRIDPKSFTTLGQKRRGREDIVSLPSRRLLFQGQAIVSTNRNFNGGNGTPLSRSIPCTVLILTDSLVFTQEISLKFHFVSPPGIVMLNNLIVRENAGDPSSIFLFLGTGSAKPEMIELQVINPDSRGVWMQRIGDAIKECGKEADASSDVDEEVDPADLSDLKTARMLEELQEQDKQLISALRSRAKLIENLRTDKQFHWASNSVEGKDDLFRSLASSCSEVQKVIQAWEANAASSVIRSTSCVGEHGINGLNANGLPKRADTFGGFDCQQRSALELSQCAQNKILMDMVVQLSHLCGELFSQMLPQLMPSVYQTHHQLQRRMEDLREAQQRLETEKAIFQQEVTSQKETIGKEKSELSALKQQLQKEQEDIIQQREQLYRKLEALQRQGIRPPLDPLSPLSTAQVVEKPPVAPVPARRPQQNPVHVQQSQQAQTAPSSQNGTKSKQQLPLFLASTSSFKAGKVSDGPTPVLRQQQHQQQHQLPNRPDSTRQSGRLPSSKSSSAVQQLLPLRLSEGNSNKTSSLPRGASVATMLHQMDGIQRAANTSDQIQSNPSFLYGPLTGQNGRGHHPSGPETQNGSDNSLNIVHRRSGSSPVPMSQAQPIRNVHFHQHQHPFFRPCDDDGEKILFL